MMRKLMRDYTGNTHFRCRRRVGIRIEKHALSERDQPSKKKSLDFGSRKRGKKWVNFTQFHPNDAQTQFAP